MEAEQVSKLIEQSHEVIRKSIILWHEKKMEQIRLETANKRKIEEYKHHLITEAKNGR